MKWWSSGRRVWVHFSANSRRLLGLPTNMKLTLLLRLHDDQVDNFWIKHIHMCTHIHSHRHPSYKSDFYWRAVEIHTKQVYFPKYNLICQFLCPQSSYYHFVLRGQYYRRNGPTQCSFQSTKLIDYLPLDSCSLAIEYLPLDSCSLALLAWSRNWTFL